jgi:hypothetical protein
MLQKGEVAVDDDDDEWEPVKAITSPCDSFLGYWRLSAKKPVYIGDPVPAYTCEGGGSILT